MNDNIPGMASSVCTRRRFLGTAAAGVLATALLPRRSPGENAAPAARKDKLNVACIGMGGMMMGMDLNLITGLGQNVTAVCDVDESQVEKAKAAVGGKAKGYKDYRKLLEEEKNLDAVIIATPDHWHAPIIMAAMEAGKHIYCEKPLAHDIWQTRKIRELARKSKVITQTGNQGSASKNLRRNIELIQAGVIGQVHDIYIWHPEFGFPTGVNRPDGGDPVPAGLDWNFWIGPSPMRPYKRDIYHPAKWRGWYDYGNGIIGDFCCHVFNLPVRALNLGYPEKIEVSGTNMDKESFPSTSTVRYHFPKKDKRGPVRMHFYSGSGGPMPPDDITRSMVDTFGRIDRVGCIMVGDKGMISAGFWNSDGYIIMKGESKYKGIFNHDAAKAVPTGFRKVDSHMGEWVDACLGGSKTYSDFDFGGYLTEIGLAGVVALRLGHDIEWNGEKMKVKGVKEAGAIIRPDYRPGWGI